MYITRVFPHNTTFAATMLTRVLDELWADLEEFRINIDPRKIRMVSGEIPARILMQFKEVLPISGATRALNQCQVVVDGKTPPYLVIGVDFDRKPVVFNIDMKDLFVTDLQGAVKYARSSNHGDFTFITKKNMVKSTESVLAGVCHVENAAVPVLPDGLTADQPEHVEELVPDHLGQIYADAQASIDRVEDAHTAPEADYEAISAGIASGKVVDMASWRARRNMNPPL